MVAICAVASYSYNYVACTSSTPHMQLLLPAVTASEMENSLSERVFLLQSFC